MRPSALSFSWSPIPDASSYTITLTNAKTDRRVFTRTGLTRTSFSYSQLENLDVGAFSWSLEAFQINREGRTVRTSKPVVSRFDITLGKKIGPTNINSPTKIYLR